MMKINHQNIENLRCLFFDFDGVFTDNAVFVDQFGNESVRCSRFDGIGLELLKSLGIYACVLSSDPNPTVLRRCEKLKIDAYNNLDSKVNKCNEIMQSMDLTLANAGFVGNDINDLELLSCVGFSVAVKDSHPDIISKVQYVTNMNGGYGAVREICDSIHWHMSK